jgi:HSP20 family protein
MNASTEKTGSAVPQEYYLPAVDAMETRDELVLIADMPGTRPENLEVTVEDGILTLTGTMAAPGVESRDTLQREFLRGAYYRQFRVPREFAADRIDATLKAGVVTVRIPREEKSKPRKIPVKVG